MLTQSSPTIALIDDDEPLRDLMASLLERHGYQVQTYANGNGFLAADDHDQVTLILSDVDMPDGDGFDVVSYAALNNIPVILVTGLPDGAMLEAVRSAGATAVLRKPVAPSALWRVLRQSLPEASHAAS